MRVVNLKAAGALGLTLPQSILALANEVIELKSSQSDVFSRSESESIRMSECGTLLTVSHLSDKVGFLGHYRHLLSGVRPFAGVRTRQHGISTNSPVLFLYPQRANCALRMRSSRADLAGEIMRARAGCRSTRPRSGDFLTSLGRGRPTLCRYAGRGLATRSKCSTWSARS